MHYTTLHTRADVNMVNGVRAFIYFREGRNAILLLCMREVYNRSASIMNVDNRRGWPLLWYRKTNGRAKRHFCFSGTDEVIVGEEMEISLNKLYIWNQQTTGNPMLVFLSRVSLVFINWQIFILHFHYDNFSLTETFSLQNVRSPRGNRFPKRKRKLDNMLRSYAWFLQSVSMI